MVAVHLYPQTPSGEWKKAKIKQQNKKIMITLCEFAQWKMVFMHAMQSMWICLCVYVCSAALLAKKETKIFSETDVFRANVSASMDVSVSVFACDWDKRQLQNKNYYYK